MASRRGKVKTSKGMKGKTGAKGGKERAPSVLQNLPVKKKLKNKICVIRRRRWRKSSVMVCHLDSPISRCIRAFPITNCPFTFPPVILAQIHTHFTAKGTMV